MAHVAIVGVASVFAARLKRQTNKRLAERKESAEKSNTALDEARAKLERCECELALTHADHDEALDRLDEAKDECEKLKKQAKTERETSARLRFALTVANGQKEKLKVENERLTLAAQKKAGEEARANEEVRMLKEKAANANKATEQARKSVQELTAKNGALVKELEALKHELEDSKMAISGLDAARKRNVELAEEIEKRHQEYSAIEHALQDAEINLRQAESHNVQLKLENEDLSDHVVQLRAHELELQQELKNMLETLTMVTSQHAEDDEGAEGGASGFASPIAMERIMAKINTPTAERIGAHAGENDDMQDVQARMAVLLSRVEECKTPQGISKAIAELDELQVKLRDIKSATDVDEGSPPRGPGSGSPDAWPISPPSPVTTSKSLTGADGPTTTDLDEDDKDPQTPPRTLEFDEPSTPWSSMCSKCGAVPRTDGCDGRCAECYRIKQEKLAQSPLARFSNSIKKTFSSTKERADNDRENLPEAPQSPLSRFSNSFKKVLSPNKAKEKETGGKKKGKKKGKK